MFHREQRRIRFWIVTPLQKLAPWLGRRKACVHATCGLPQAPCRRKMIPKAEGRPTGAGADGDGRRRAGGDPSVIFLQRPVGALGWGWARLVRLKRRERGSLPTLRQRQPEETSAAEPLAAGPTNAAGASHPGGGRRRWGAGAGAVSLGRVLASWARRRSDVKSRSPSCLPACLPACCLRATRARR